MADFVVTWEDGIKYPNIHGHYENYKNNARELTTYRAGKQNFENIKTRYLAMMKQQLINPDIKTFKLIEALILQEGIESIESDIETALADRYNSMNNVLVYTDYKAAAKTLEKAFLSKQADNAALLSGLNLLVELFLLHTNEIGLLKLILEHSDWPIPTTVDDLLGVQEIIDKAVEIWNKNEDTSVSNSLTAVLTLPSEAIAAALAIVSLVCADDSFLDTIKESLTGTKGESITTINSDLEEKKIFSKVADFILKNVLVKWTASAGQVGKSGILSTEFSINTGGTVKTYRSNETGLKLTLYGGKNSILMYALRKIYPNTDEVNYQIYNTLAFDKKYKSDGNIVDTNFRIIRSDLIALEAEKYLVGYNAETAPRVFIYNYHAYPILAILSAIIAEAQKAIENKTLYGHSSDIFTILFEDLPDNHYYGKVNNYQSKIWRIQDVKKEIDTLTTKGKLNIDVLERSIGQYLKPNNGISLVGMVP